MQRDLHDGFGSVSDAVTEHLRSSTVQLGNQRHDGQANAKPSFTAVEGPRRLAKQLECLIQMLCGNSYTAVPHAHHRPVTLPVERYTNVTAWEGELHRVADEISEHLFQPHRIGIHDHRLVRQL